MAMSLINKMLKDLEARQGNNPGRNDRPIFQDLLPVREEQRQTHRLLIPGVVVMILAAVGYSAWHHLGPNTEVPPTATLAAPVVLPAARPEPIQPIVSSAAPPVTSASSSDPVGKVAGSVEPKPAVKSRVAAKASSRAPAASGPVRIEKTEHRYTPEELAENAYREAVRLQAQNNPVEAERRLRALLVNAPRHVKARELLAGIQIQTGRWLDAQSTLEQGVARMPETLAFRAQLARLLLEHGAEAQAVTVLERARSEGHVDAELHAFLAALYQRADRHSDAVQSYQSALRLSPQEGKWWIGLGISFESQQNAAAARDAYRRALSSGRLATGLSRYAEGRLQVLANR
jgi:MSHA biogenesis protein MshN